MSAFTSIVLRLPHVKGAWPEGYLDGFSFAGPSIEPEDLPRLDRVFIRIEWPEHEQVEMWIFVIGVHVSSTPKTIILHQQRTRYSRADWPDIVKETFSKFKCHYIVGSDDVMFALEALEIGPTVREWVEVQEEMARQEFKRELHTNRGGH